MTGQEEAETEDDFDIEDVYSNTDLKPAVWRSYIEYLKNLSHYLQKGSKLKMTGEQKGLLLRKCFRAALKFTNANVNKSGKLYNLWGRLGHQAPLEATAKYIRSLNVYGTDEFDKLWRRYEIDEEDTRSIFSNSDRLKIMNTAINELVTIPKLKYYNHIVDFFPLHNEHDMKGINRIRHGAIYDDDRETNRRRELEREGLSKI